MYNFNEIIKRETEKYGTTYSTEIQQIRERFFHQKRDNEEQFFYSCGGAVCAPLYVGFCEWVIEVAQKENIRVIFPLMREGLLYSKILDIIIKARNLDIQVAPLWVSRKSSFFALPKNEFDFEFFKETCYSHPYMIQACFKRLGLEAHKDIYEDNQNNINLSIRQKNETSLKPIYDEIISRGLDKQINEKIIETKQLLSEYLMQNGAGNDFITMDCGTLGTLPQAIDNCLPGQNKKVHLFLKAEYPVILRREKGHDIRYLFFNSEKASEQEQTLFLTVGRILYETITMGNLKKGTAEKYRKEKNIVCVENTPYVFDEKIGKKIDFMQAGILDFCTEYVKLEQKCEEEFPSKTLVQSGMESYARMINYPFLKEAVGLGEFDFDDSENGVKMKLVVETGCEGELLELTDDRIDVSVGKRNKVAIWSQGSLLISSIKSEKSAFNRTTRKIAIYGAGDYGKRVVDRMQQYNVEIRCIIDKNKAGLNLGEYPIIEINELAGYDVSDIIIASINYEEEMIKAVQEYSKAAKKTYNLHRILA